MTGSDGSVGAISRRRAGLIAGLASIGCGLAAAVVFRQEGAAIPVALAIVGIVCSVYSWRHGARILAAVGAIACVSILALIAVFAWGFWAAGELTF
jgi:hypothetical protein